MSYIATLNVGNKELKFEACPMGISGTLSSRTECTMTGGADFHCGMWPY